MSEAKLIELLFAKVSKLEAKLQNEREQCAHFNESNMRLSNRNAKLREALEPFARWCTEMDGECPRLADDARVSSDITMGDCRRASAALKETGDDNGL